MQDVPGFRTRAGRWTLRRAFASAAFAVALLVQMAGAGAPVPAAAAVTAAASATPNDDGGGTWMYPERLDDGRATSRLDRCRLGFVVQAGGPAIKTVAQNGLT